MIRTYIPPPAHPKTDKTYIYPDYDIFQRGQCGIGTNIFIHETLQRFIIDAIFAQGEEKPVDLLTNDEKLGIFIGAGVPLKYENGKIQTMYEVSIQLMDGKYIVGCKYATT